MKRRTAPLLVLAGALLMAPLGVAMAQTPASVIGAYNAKGDGPGMQMIYDNAGGAGGSHPVGYGAVPEAAAEAESGFGHAVSSVIWPGPLVGNLGTAAPLLPGVGQLPSQITGPVLPLLHDNGNDPIKAEATSGSKPDATYGAPNTAAYLAAHADEAKVTAHAETRGFDAQAGGYAGDVVSDGVTNASASAVTATGSSVASNIVMAAGLLTIDSVVSKASATTDGTRSSGTSRITVSGMKIGGVPATVDDQGLHIQGQGGSVSPLNDGLSQFAQAGLKVTLTKPQEVHDGAAESIMAGSLVVSFTPPNNPSGDTFQTTFGGAIAQVNANLGVPDPSAGSDGATTSSGGTASVPSGGGDVSGTSAPVPDIIQPKLKSLKPGPVARLAIRAAPVGFGGSLPTGLVIVGLFGVAVAGVGLKRLSTNVLAVTPAATACPLEERR